MMSITDSLPALAATLCMAMLALGCSSRPADPMCSDGVHNGDESDVDCGGTCVPCADDSSCDAPGDCLSQVCEGGTCAAPRCGDGVVNQPGESCDDAGDSAICNASCTLSACGDGIVNANAAEVCDDAGESTTCNVDCTLAACGDGHVNVTAGEQCDDGNASNNDDCLDTCITPMCGDGLVWNQGQGTEQCDDGNANNNDDCLSVCLYASCGDGFEWNQGMGTEECDDGNTVDADDCTSICEIADCTDGIMNADESDVDCGGHCGPQSCHAGQMCNGDGDCASNSCVGVCEPDGGIVTGLSHTCALDSAGAVRCWGFNFYGQLGYGYNHPIGDNELPSSAGTVNVGDNVVQLAAGAYHTCALLRAGAVRCWGRNDSGQLGYGNTSNIGDNELPSSAGGIDVGGAAVGIAAGANHTCALLDTGAVRCWGDNSYGQLGYGHTSSIGDDELPSSAGDIDLGGTAVEITAASDHTCVRLDTGAVRCWGRNGFGQLGYGHTNSIGDDELPSATGDISLGGRAIQVDSGGLHTCALLDTGAVVCWGWNYYSQLGHGNNNNIGDDELPSSAGPVSLGDTATLLMSSYYHNCAVLSSGGLRCWGWNVSGQLGYGNTSNIGDNELPSSVGDVSVGGVVDELAVGAGHHTCARLTTGAIRCWGRNYDGQLGYGNSSHIGDNELPSSAGDVPYE